MDKGRYVLQHLSTLVCLAFVLLTTLPVQSQSSVTSVRGTVEDPSGAYVTNAQVHLKNNGSNASQTTVTSSRGEYQFLQVAPGNYTISVSAAGFSTMSTVADLLISQPATANFTLLVGTEATTVQVSGETPSINTTDATIGNAMSNSTIEALPIEGRNVADLLSLQPGVLYLGRGIDQNFDSRSGATAGSRSDQGNLTLDGIDNNDQVLGFGFTGVLRATLDSTQEFRVTTTGSNADVGRSSGAQVDSVTKSGTNQLHGSLYEYHRDRTLAANDWFFKKAELNQGLPNVPGQLIRNTFGASLGGPIKKSKLFYFLNYEGQRTAENKQVVLSVPTASMRAGNVNYVAVGGSVVTLTPEQIATMDPNCTGNNTCPLGAGVNPAVIEMLNRYPLPNGRLQGDGINIQSFTWSAPNPASLNTYIAKVDYLVSNKNQLFVRGILQNDKNDGPPQLPGDAPSSANRDNSKGLAVGLTSSLRSNLINNFRYGFIRQGVSSRGSTGNFANLPGISPFNSQRRTSLHTLPVHNIVDNMVWQRGNHSIQFGVNFRHIDNFTQSDFKSWSGATGTSNAFPGGIANTGSSLDPAAFGFPEVDPSRGVFGYNATITTLAGLLPRVTDSYNYHVSQDGLTGELLPQGLLIPRRYRNNEFEYYFQDSWRVRPNLTVTFGLRHTYQQTPWEVDGQQVQPTFNVHDWFNTRARQAALGNSVQPLFSFAPSGHAHNGKPYWDSQKANFAPRFAIAYAPSAKHGLLHMLFGGEGKSSIRAGAGMYYDHFGQAIVNSFNHLGAFSLTTDVLVPGGTFIVDTAPRFTSPNSTPHVKPAPASSISYPQTPPSVGNFSYGIDDGVKTPYSYAFNLTIQRELPGRFTLETSYVGRLGRHLLQSTDIGAPLNLVDPKSHTDYFTAATSLSKAAYAGATTVAAVPYWENLFPDAAGGGNSATQNIYDNLWLPLVGEETSALQNLDLGCFPGCGGQLNRYILPQYVSLYAWTTNGTSSYHAGQTTLRRQMTGGLLVDVSYTYSKSIDLGSDAARNCIYCGPGSGGPGSGSSFGGFSPVINTWNIKQNRGPSDFDTTHIVTGDWVYELPFGRGRYMGGAANGVVNAIIGGWRISGLARWTSGLPFSTFQGPNFPTNIAFEAYSVQTGHIDNSKHINKDGNPVFFANPEALANGLPSGPPIRNALPGENGQRNLFRGDGYFGVDMGLGKSWKFHEDKELRFQWEVFNVTNTPRFDSNEVTGNLQADVTGPDTLGVSSQMLNAPRVQQFSLRLMF